MPFSFNLNNLSQWPIFAMRQERLAYDFNDINNKVNKYMLVIFRLYSKDIVRPMKLQASCDLNVYLFTDAAEVYKICVSQCDGLMALEQ